MVDAAANGRAISQHTPACYQQALAELPGDVDSYLPAVRANLMQAMRRDADARRAAVTAQRNARSTQSALERRGRPGGRRRRARPGHDLLEGLGPAHVDEVPLPVVALGGACGAAPARRPRHLARPRALAPPRRADRRRSAWLSRLRLRPTALPLYLACLGDTQRWI